jgi:hypothetical protein
VENLRIVQVFGPEARQVSPRVGHLHVIVDDLPWWWADASDNNTVDIANLPPGSTRSGSSWSIATTPSSPGET